MIKWVRKKIGRRIYVPVLLAAVCAVVGIFFVAGNTFTGVVTELVQDHVLDQYKDFIATIEERQNLALTAALTIAGRPDVQEAFANQDRELLPSLSQLPYEELNAKFGVAQFHYHTAPAMSFLRVHGPARFGDDLSSLRPMVVDAIASQSMAEGLESGWAGVGIRGIVPLRHDSEFVGTLEIGFDFSEDFLDSFVEDRDLEVGVYLITDPSFPEMAGSQQVTEDLWLYATTMHDYPAYAHLDLIDRVREIGEPAVARSDESGTASMILVGPLLSYSGDVIGFVQLHQDLSPVVDRLWSSFLQLLLVLMMLLTAMGSVIFLAVRRLSAPLAAMNRAAHDAADGDLTQRIDVIGDDEIALLAAAFNEMTDNLKHLLHRISDASQYLSASSEELVTTMEQMDDGIEWMSMALDEMSLGAGAQAERAGDAVRTVSHLVETTDQIANNSQETHQASGLASQLVHEQMEVVEVLVQKLSQIERIVTAIEKIARRTNLLSLNASIEA